MHREAADRLGITSRPPQKCTDTGNLYISLVKIILELI